MELVHKTDESIAKLAFRQLAAAVHRLATDDDFAIVRIVQATKDLQ